MPLRAGCHIEGGLTRDDDLAQDYRRRLIGRLIPIASRARIGAQPSPASGADRPLHAATYENSHDLSGMCRMEAAAFVVSVRGGPRGRPTTTGDDSDGAVSDFRP